MSSALTLIACSQGGGKGRGGKEEREGRGGEGSTKKMRFNMVLRVQSRAIVPAESMLIVHTLSDCVCVRNPYEDTMIYSSLLP